MNAKNQKPNLSPEKIIAYCDSFFTSDSASFLRHSRERHADGALITYPSNSAMDGYAEIDGDGRVLRTAEKEIISPTAAAVILGRGETLLRPPAR